MKKLFAGLVAAISMIGAHAAPAQASTEIVRYNFTTESAVNARYRGKQVVSYETGHAPGTIIVNTSERYLYFVLEDGEAIRYGIGVGREGFSWSGTTTIARKAEWPGWTPPAAMRLRQPELPAYMEGGPDNPLGARALYLYDGGVDTLYRIHGTAEPWTIGQAVSSGCIRMLNDEVIDLYERAQVGARVVVI